MERTITPPTKPLEERMANLQVLASTVVSRMMLGQQMGLQYGGTRDIYQALGYPSENELTWTSYFGKYKRHDMGKAIVDRPVKATWQGPLELIESSIAEDTPFEKAWKDLDRRLGLKTRFSRVDKLTGIGRYGVLFLGLDDVSDQAGFAKPVKKGSNKELLYVKPFGENSAKIHSYVENPADVRYGLPLLYEISIVDMATKKNQSVKVHFSRIIHIVDDVLESEVLGTPRLEAVYNRLMDLEKVVGGDAEMFWRGARPGYSGKLDPEYQMTEATKNDLKDQIDEYENNLRRILISEGVDLKNLAQQIADPSGHVDVQIQMISAVTGIPKRILTGSERGELASTQDTSEWKEYVQGRRDEHAEPQIIRPFVDRLIEIGILPEPTEDYTVKWVDLYSQSEKSKVEIGKGRANALREYTSNPIAMELIPLPVFLEFFLGFSTDEVTYIQKKIDEGISEEQIMKDIEGLINPPTPTIPAGKPIDKKNKRSKGETKIPA